MTFAEIGSNSHVLACFVFNAAIHHRRCESVAHNVGHEVTWTPIEFCAEELSMMNIISTQQRHVSQWRMTVLMINRSGDAD